MACREASSFFPLYLSWILRSSGWISCMPREALICLTNRGMRMIRMTTVRPTIDSAHVHPDAGSIPIEVSSEWNWTMIQATAISIGLRISNVCS